MLESPCGAFVLAIITYYMGLITFRKDFTS